VASLFPARNAPTPGGPIIYRSFRTPDGNTALVVKHESEEARYDVEVLDAAGELVDWHHGLTHDVLERLAAQKRWRET
jgi:hypothetical protein